MTFTKLLARRAVLRSALGTTTAVPMLTSRDTVEAIGRTALAATAFGVRFDGRSDDSVALQRALDEAARQHRPLVLPAGIARVTAPLDLKGRYVALLGSPTGHSIVRAGAPMPCLIDAEESSEVIDSPLYLFGMMLDGGGLVGTGLRLRYRHRTVFDTVQVGGCDIGFDEWDAWLSRRINCCTRGTRIGWRLRGANHSSQWLGCSFTDAREIHLDIGAGGSASDGNDALLFQGCDVEYGLGHGICIAANATASFETCYLGEAISGDVLRNAGTVTVRGGALFVGYRGDRTGIVPEGGRAIVAEVSVRGQHFGSLDRLVGSGGGRVVFRDVDMHLQIGGDQVLPGDVLGTLPMRVFAPTLGRGWQVAGNDVDLIDTVTGDTRQLQCRAVKGPAPLIGFAASLRDAVNARHEGPAYCVIVYSATQPMELKFSNGAIGRAPTRLIGTLPATRSVQTYVKADVPMAFTQFSTVELIARAGLGDAMALHHATISDGSTIEPGILANLARAR